MSSDKAAGRQGYFEALYAGNPDPWQYQTGAYEIAKRQDTLSFLKPSYQRACEVGCSIGVLTQDLAPRCGRLVGFDVSPKAVDLAQQRLQYMPGVSVEMRHLPYDDLEANLDLLVLSEMLYFLDAEEIALLATQAGQSMVADGDLLIVSYDGATQTQLNGRQSSDLFVSAALDFEQVRFEQREHYHVRLLRRRRDVR